MKKMKGDERETGTRRMRNSKPTLAVLPMDQKSRFLFFGPWAGNACSAAKAYKDGNRVCLTVGWPTKWEIRICFSGHASLCRTPCSATMWEFATMMSPQSGMKKGNILFSTLFSVFQPCFFFSTLEI